MKLFLDTANVDEIRKANEMGVICGVTTNPSLIAKEGRDYAETLKDEYGFNLVYFEDSPTMYQAVLGGQCVACFEDTPIMQATIKDNGLALKCLEDTANAGGDYGFAIFNADNQELLDMFNKGLANIKANGTYDQILAKYLG